jgi:plastocyanin/predicted membrane protein
MKGFRNRILAPLGIPLVATAVILTVAFNFSRILLLLEKRQGPAVSTVVAIFAAAAVLFASAYFASRLEAHAAGLAVLGTAAVVLVFAGGYGLGFAQAPKGEGGEGGEGPAAAPPASSTELVAHEFSFTPKDISVPVGPAKFTLKNEGNNLHTFQFETVPQFRKLVAQPRGGSASGVLEVGPGTYTFYCSETGHRGAGMQGTLKVG